MIDLAIKKKSFWKLPFYCRSLLNLKHGGGQGGFFALILAMVFASGCAQNPHETGITELKLSTWGSAQELSVTTHLLQQFQHNHPDIRVKLIQIPENYSQKLHILAAADLLPDVMMINSLSYPVYADNHLLRPLPSPPQSEFYPQALNAFTWENTLYAYPRDLSNLVIFYNKDLFRAAHVPFPSPHWTLSDYLASARKLTQDSDGDGKIDVFGMSFFSKPPLLWQPFVWSNGGAVYDVSRSRLTLEQPNATEALQWLADCRFKWHVAPQKEEIGNTPMSQLFLQGQVATLLSGRWTVPVLREKAKFDWDVAPFPRGEHGSVVGIDATGFAVSAHSTHPQESMALARYLSSESALSAYTQSGLIVPARPSVAKSKAFLAGKPTHARVFLDSIATGHPSDVPASWDEFSEALNLALEPVFDGRMTTKAALKKAKPELETLLKD